MELSVNGRRRRAVRVSKAVTPQAEKAAAGTGAGAAPKRAGSDKVSWSRAALSFLQEVNRQDLERQRKLLEAKQQKNGDLEMLPKSLKVMERCRKIASRIMKGDKVPPQDEQYLMECDPDGYKLALACRVPKEKPKEWESVLEEAEEDGSGGETADSTEAAEAAGETAEC